MIKLHTDFYPTGEEQQRGLIKNDKSIAFSDWVNVECRNANESILKNISKQEKINCRLIKKTLFHKYISQVNEMGWNVNTCERREINRS